MEQRIGEFRALLDRLDAPFYDAVASGVTEVDACLRRKGTIFAFGNGGSASDASHFTAEFVGRFLKDRPGLPALSLSSEPAAITAIGNDYAFERIFERQIEALGRSGDLAVGLSTSGRSPNVLLGLERARALGIRTIALVGAAGLARPVADLVITVPSTVTYEIQQVHKIVLHHFCECAEPRS